MQYLLDTNICIYYFKGKFGLADRVHRIGFDQFAISEITLAELIYGAQKSQKVRENMEVVQSFARKIKILPIINVLEIYGREKSRLESLGTVIGDFDILIGATAIANGLTVITRNVQEFGRLQNLVVENWVAE